MEIPKIAKRLEVMNKTDNKNEATLYMYGSIGEGWYADISSKDVQSQLGIIDAKTINVHLNSPGGDVFESVTIGNLLKDHKAQVIIHIDGLAASGGSIIAMGADKVVMKKNSMMMIHKAWTYTAGNADELIKAAEDLKKIDSAVTESYTSRFVGERSELENLLAEETWLTAEECLALGLCDEISDIVPEEVEPVVENITTKEAILNKYNKQIAASVKVASTENKNNKEELHKQEEASTNLLSAFFNVLNKN